MVALRHSTALFVALSALGVACSSESEDAAGETNTDLQNSPGNSGGDTSQAETNTDAEDTSGDNSGTNNGAGSTSDDAAPVEPNNSDAGESGSNVSTADAGTNGRICVPPGAFCRQAAPSCPPMQVPLAEGSCWGDCVPIGECACSGPTDCPDEAQYTCINSTNRCSPYLR